MEQARSKRLPKCVVPLRYELSFVPHYADASAPEKGFDTFSATLKLRVLAKEDTDTIVLNSKGLTLDGPVLISWGVKKLTALSSDFDASRDFLTLRFGEKLLAGTEAELSIPYKGPVTTDSTGIYQNTYNLADGSTKVGIATQLATSDARKMFPGFDEPEFKAVFSLSITVPKVYDVLSNMPLQNSIDKGLGLVQHTFQDTPKMSSYLLALFVGEGDFVSDRTKSGTEVRVWTPKGSPQLGAFSLEIGVKALEFFEDFYNIPYPLEKMDMVGLQNFLYGGMENWGLIFYADAYLNVSDATPASRRRLVAYVVCHEIAHQWFGNLVTMEWWNEVWLNEGFATYAGWLALDAIRPAYNIPTYVFGGETRRAYESDGFLTTHPVEVDPNLDDVGEINALIDDITYRKGFQCLVMAADLCGLEAFRVGVSSYLQAFAYGSATTAELWHHLEEASGKPVAKVIGTWTKLEGYPLLEVSREGDAITVTQSRFLLSGASVDSELWEIPIAVEYENAAEPARFHLSSKSAVFQLPVEAARSTWLKLNAGESTLVRVAYSPGMYSDLIGNVRKLRPIDCVGLIASSADLARAGKLRTDKLLRLLLVLADDEDPHVTKQVLSVLSMVHSVFSRSTKDANVKLALNRFGLRIVSPILRRVGFESAEGEHFDIDPLRETAFHLAIRYNDEEVVSYLLSKFNEWNTGAPMVPVLQAYVFHHGKEGVATLQQLLASETDPSTRKNIAIAMAMATDAEAFVKYLHQVPSGNMLVTWQAVGPLVDVLFPYFVENYDELYAKEGGGANSFGRIVAAPFEMCSDLALAEQLQDFVQNKVPEEHRSKIIAKVKRSVENVTLNHQWIEADFELVVELVNSVVGLPDSGTRPEDPPTKKGPGIAAPDPQNTSASAELSLKRLGVGAAVVVLAGAASYAAYRFFSSSSASSNN